MRFAVRSVMVRTEGKGGLAWQTQPRPAPLWRWREAAVRVRLDQGKPAMTSKAHEPSSGSAAV